MMHGGGWWSYLRYDESKGRPRVGRKLLRRVMGYARPYSAYVVLILIAIAVTSILGLIPPLLYRDLIDSVLPQGDVADVEQRHEENADVKRHRCQRDQRAHPEEMERQEAVDRGPRDRWRSATMIRISLFMLGFMLMLPAASLGTPPPTMTDAAVSPM